MIFGLALLSGAAYLGWLELLPYQPARAVDGAPAGPVTDAPILSLQAQQVALLRCSDWMNSVRSQVQPSEVRLSGLRSCLALADSIARTSPTHALAYLTGATAALGLGDARGMAARLQQSQRMAPTEQWLAQGRVELAEKARAAATPEPLDLEDADLALLVRSQSGIGAIAGRYVSQPDFRERITRIVAGLPVEDQARFVDWVGRAIRGTGT